MLLAVDAALFLGPLLVFTGKLRASRTEGMRAYMGLAARYVTDFEQKSLGQAGGAPAGESPLGTPDLQSLADLTKSVNVVRHMRWIPAGPRLLQGLALAALAPFAPLLLFQYPLVELVQRIITRLIGL